MSELNPLAQDLAKVIEPWTVDPVVSERGAMSVIADSGTTVDLNMRRPKEPEPETLYVWPVTHVHNPEGAGNPPEDREDFSIQFLYVVDREGEEPTLDARRDVSDQLDERAAEYTVRVAANRSKYASGQPAPWEHIQAAVQHDTAVTFGVRGIGLLVTGYRYVS